MAAELMIPRPCATAARSGSAAMTGQLPMGFIKGLADTPSSKSTSDGGLEYIYLKEYFGFEDFRPGQREVVLAATEGRDVTVFWATGAGKSLCYQLPALQSGKTVLVVSPLISLMQDQVIKFNATIGTAEGGHRACLLGSAQHDPTVEQAALRGEYRLVYVTPEKLAGGFLDKLKGLHAAKKLELLAVDEAHCISEWGHDFRPSYRELRRVRSQLAGLPIMALTATAVPRVQEDIVAQLELQQGFFKSQSSFDRTNLRIACSRKGERAADLSRIAKDILANAGSTIVYVPTQAETENVATFLIERLVGSGIQVVAYHAGRSPGEREDAHVAFLSGQAQVVVATVAFGMGIDKPDIRRVIHYGPPKTVEEYFQQIGRAGRDGLTSVCELFCNDSDFSKYSDGFYTKGLTAQAKEQTLLSTAALRRYASESTCRRHWLLKYFGETPLFGDKCGTCDVCTLANTDGAGDSHRDFRQAAAPVLEAVGACASFPQSLTNILSIIAGSWKPKGGSIDGAVKDAMTKIAPMREALPRPMRQECFNREMIGMLCNAGILTRKRVTASIGGCARSFEVYELTEKGKLARLGSQELRLPVPPELRKQEEKEREKLKARAKEIKEAGLDPSKLSAKELDNDNNPLLWYIRKLKLWKDSGKEVLIKKAEAHEELRRRILAWRDAAAVRLHMAPADVLPEHLAANISYVQPTTVDALRETGVRIVGIEELAKLVAQAKQELFTTTEADESSQDGPQKKRSVPLLLPSGLWTPSAKWVNAVYKTSKAGAKPTWELYYDRFAKGENLQAIAMNPPSGKPVQIVTVAGHVMTALTFGRAVDFDRLFGQWDATIPDEADWRQLEEAVAAGSLDFQAADFKQKDLLCGILGEGVNRAPAEKSAADSELEKRWYEKIRLWLALKRAGFSASFGEEGQDSKRQRT